MLIQLRVGDSLLMYEVSSFAQLCERAGVHFRAVADPTARLAFAYDVPSSDGFSAIRTPIQSEGDFLTCLATWDDVIRPTQLRLKQPLLPLIEAAVVKVGEVSKPNKTVRPNKAVAGMTQEPQGSLEQQQQQQEAPPPIIAPQPSALNYAALPLRTFVSAIDTDWYRSHDLAVKLLASFKEQSAPDVPTIRVTLRGGQASSRIAFNPYNRPDIANLKEAVQSELICKLLPEDKDLILQNLSAGKTRTQLFAVLPTSPVEIDVDDIGDIQLVCDVMKQLKDDFSVMLICEFVDVEEESHRDDERLVPSDLVESVILPSRGCLSVNLAHTPKRDRSKKPVMSFEDEEDV